jgi:hypothetical protein
MNYHSLYPAAIQDKLRAAAAFSRSQEVRIALIDSITDSLVMSGYARPRDESKIQQVGV